MFTRRFIIIYHIIVWVLFFTMVLAFVTSGMEAGSSLSEKISSPAFILFALLYLAIFYLNQFVLTPKLFIQKKYFVYGLIILVLIALVIYLKPFEQLLEFGRSDRKPPPGIPQIVFDGKQPGEQPRRTRFDIISIILFFMAWAVSTLIVLLQRWQTTERNRATIEIEKINAELSFLKAQISPHFLFNTLNNIYALALKKSDATASSILRLSNIMRYVTDDARESFVPVENEIACLNDFIDLQKLRHGKNLVLNYELTGEYKNVKIAPMILTAFVENVFKHGVSKKKESRIIVKINVCNEQIHLFTQNDSYKSNFPAARSGVGLDNVKKRLQHLYLSAHKLEINDDGESFTVNLYLQNK